MSTNIEWVLALKDLITPGAQSAGNTVINLNVQLKQAEDQAKKTESAMMRFAKGMARGWGIPLPSGKDNAGFLGSMAARGGSFFGDLGKSWGLSIVDALADAGKEFGTLLVDGVAFREEVVEGFKAVYGSAQGASDLFDHALEIAKLTKFETRQVVDLYNDLAAGGFREGELNTITAGIADVATARGSAKAQELQNALIKMRSEGRTTWDSFAEAGRASAGIAIREVARALKFKDADTGDLGKLGKKVREAMNKGLVDSNMGISAVLDKIKDRYDPQGVLGDYAKAQSETLSGIISNVKDALKNLFMSKETASLSGITTLKETLKMITGWMDPATDKGKRLLTVVNRIASDLLGLFKLDPKNAEQAFDKMLGWLESFESGVKRATTWITDELYPAISSAFNSEGGFLKTIGSTLLAIMTTAGSAFAKGMASYFGIDDIVEKRRADRAPRYQFPAEDGRIKTADAPPLAATLSRPQATIDAPVNLGGVTIQIDGAKSPQETGDAVAGALAGLARRNRAMSPAER